MKRYTRTVLLLVTVVLVALAGCSGGTGDGGPAGNDNETSPTITATTASTSTFDYPAGWSADGIESLDEALAGHYSAEARGDTFTERFDFQRSEDGEETLNNSIVYQVDLDAGELRATLDGTVYQRVAYYNDGTLYNYDLKEEEVVSQSETNLSVIANASRESLSETLRGLEMEATEIVQRNGVTGVRYQVTSTENGTSGRFDEASGTIVVLENGQVSSFDLTKRSDDVVLRGHYEVVAVGSTDVTRPSWVPE